MKIGDLELTEVDELEMSPPDYNFDLVRVWKDQNGVHWWGADSGCSCPSPYEDFNKIEDFTKLDNEHEFDKLKDHVSTSYEVESRSNFLNNVRDSLAGEK